MMLSPPSSYVMTCPDCNMTFKSSALMTKHRQKFCVGAFSDVNNKKEEAPVYPTDRPLSDLKILNEKMNQLKELKQRHKTDTELRNFEDSMLANHRTNPYAYSNHFRLKLADDRVSRSSAATNSSMSIHLPSESNSPRESRMRDLAAAYEQNITQLHINNAELEKQKEGIRRRLEQLSRQGDGPGSGVYHLEDLKSEEDKNQRMLAELKHQLSHAQQKGPKATVYPYQVFPNNSLVADISAFRQQYINLGGSDSEVLRQTTNMMREAQTLDEKNRRQSPTNVQTDGVHHQIQGVELENQRLHTELILLQQRNLMQQNKATDNSEEEQRSLQKEHMRKLTMLQNEMEILKHQAELERYKRELSVAKTPVKDERRSKTPPRDASPALQPPVPGYAPVLHPPVPHVPQDEADVPYLLRGGRGMELGQYSLHPSHYDEMAGFVIFYDFILGLDPTLNSCRLAVAMRTSDSDIYGASVLPTVDTDHTGSTLQLPHLYHSASAIIGAKQPVSNCMAQSDQSLVVELQASGANSSHQHFTRLVTRAWTKIQLFDPGRRLIAGYYMVPLRLTPLQPDLPAQLISNLHKFGTCELYYRIVHGRDSNQQSLLPITIHNHPLYKAPPLHQIVSPEPSATIYQPAVLPPPITTPPQTPAHYPITRPHHSPTPSIQSTHSIPLPPHTNEEKTIGMQVHRLKHCKTGAAKVRLTAYYTNTGKAVQGRNNAVTCCTSPVHSTFMYTYHIFGEQEAVFSGVPMRGDMVLLVKVYLQDGSVDDMFSTTDSGRDEQLIAWSCLPLVVMKNDVLHDGRTSYDPDSMQINTGTHTLPLYQPSVPLPNHLPLGDSQKPSSWLRYGKASVKIHVSHGSPRPSSPTPSVLSDVGDMSLPATAWIRHERRRLPSEPYVAGDGFDVYIDGCRFLPDSVTFSRVAGRILDSAMIVLTDDVYTGVELDSDMYNPVYAHRHEVRKKLTPSATLVLKVYTIGMYEPHLTTVGYALLNICVESGTDIQATNDSTQVSLNEGAHQLRLYSQGPSPHMSLNESCLLNAGVRPVPCASILVRLHKVPHAPNKKVPQSEKVPRSEWENLGLWHAMPDYKDRVYYSTKCTPTTGEVIMFESMYGRDVISVRDAITESAQARHTKLDSKKNMDVFIRNKLTRQADVAPLDLDLNHICPYNPVHGIKFKIDSAMNLPWDNFTLVHTCLNPPAAFYQGPPNVSYDHLSFTEHLHPDSTTAAPVWLDHFTHLPNRAYHRHLTLIVHLQEVEVNVTTDNYKYGLIDQAWTVLPVFTKTYPHTAAFLMPLFTGAPTQDMLAQLCEEPTRQWLEKSIRSGLVKLMKGASVFVLVGDSRRVEEIDFDGVTNSPAHVNKEFIPDGFQENYHTTITGEPCRKIIPEGKSAEQFLDGLGKRFKKLVYKLYEEDSL